jgi:hypothetical protein
MNSKTTSLQRMRRRNGTLLAALALLVAGTGIWFTLATGGTAAAGKQAGSPGPGRVLAASPQGNAESSPWSSPKP